MLFLIIWLLCGIISALIAQEKGKSPILWLVIGCVFGIFGVVASLLIPKENK